MDFSHLEQLEKKGNTRLSTKHQVRGVDICKALDCDSYALIIKLYKQNPAICEQAFSWVSDYPNARNKSRLFVWKYYQLKRGSDDKRKNMGHI